MRLSPSLLLISSALVLIGCAGRHEALKSDEHATGTAIDRVEVTDWQSGCFGGANDSHDLRLNGQTLTSSMLEVPESKAVHAWNVLLASQHVGVDPLPQLGITPETVAAHRDFIRQTVAQMSPGADEESLSEVARYDRVAAAVQHDLENPPGGTLVVHFGVTVHRGNDTLIAVTTGSCFPWMIPWKVRHGSETWVSFSVDVAEALSAFAAKDDSALTLLMREKGRSEPKPIWAGNFVGFGGPTSLDITADRLTAEHLYSKLPGWESARNTWHVEKGYVDPRPPVLKVVLERATPATDVGTVSSIQWSVPLENGKPTADWRELEEITRRANRLIALHRWLSDWARSGEGRSIQLEVDGRDRFDGDPRLQRLNSVTRRSNAPSLWRIAGLAGSPEVEIVLRRWQSKFATIYLGSSDPRALIVEASSVSDQKHWLEGLDVPTNGNAFVIVEPDGTHKP